MLGPSLAVGLAAGASPAPRCPRPASACTTSACSARWPRSARLLAPLAKQVTRAYSSSKGLTLAMHSGLLVYFGDGTRPHAKWLSLARVLADPSSAGASYVDVRLPERPAAGFPGGVAPAAERRRSRSLRRAASGGGESTESLAEGLSKAAGGSAAATARRRTQLGAGEAEEKAEAEALDEPASEATSPATDETGG